MNPILTHLLPINVLDSVNDLNNARMLAKRTPDEMSASHVYEQLGQALDSRVQEIAPGSPNYYKEGRIGLEQNVPDSMLDPYLDGLKYASNRRTHLIADPTKDAYKININPNVDRAIFAHELGHVATDQTKPGKFMRSMRSNPKLAYALMLASGLVPGTVAALTPGDEDVAGATALAMATAVPTLVDEALATKNALAMMKQSGMPATVGQRGRLAGAYLSYLAKPLTVGTAASLTGNIFDQDLETPGELPPQ